MASGALSVVRLSVRAASPDPLAADHASAWGDANLDDDSRLQTWQVPDVVGYQPLNSLPLDCQANVGTNADVIRGFAVQFSDCESTWNVCMSVNNTVSLDDSIDMLRIIPISIRRYMSGITTVRQYGTEDGTTMQEGKSVTYQSITSAQNILHLASLVAPGWGLLEGDEWKAAVDRDTCVVDRLAATGYGSAFRRALVLRLDQLDKGRLLEPPDGGSLDCMSNQLAFVASIAPFSDVAYAQWHGSTCETKSDAVGLFEVQQSLEPLHKEGPDPSAAKRTGLTFTSPPLDPRAETDPITARWPLLDGSRKEDVPPLPPSPLSTPSVSSTSQTATEALKTALQPLSASVPSTASSAPEPAQATTSDARQGKDEPAAAKEPTPGPTPQSDGEPDAEYSTVAFSVVSGTFLTATSKSCMSYGAATQLHGMLLLLILIPLYFL